MKVLLIIVLLIALAVVMQLIELRRFRTTEYEIKTDKVHREVRLVLLADLHGFSYGKENRRLLKAVGEAAPDIILFCGDLIVTGHTAQYAPALKLLKALSELAPTFFTYGNHETRAHYNVPDFADFEEAMEKQGVTVLNNAFSTEPVGEDELYLYGLELPLSMYRKKVVNEMPEHFLEETLGSHPEDRFTVLLAHNPAFGDDYFDWGADLTLCGHTHGGLVRLPGGSSLISPELTLFPKYDGGHYVEGNRHLIVSKGLGTHTFHIRIFDRAEVILIRLKPQS